MHTQRIELTLEQDGINFVELAHTVEDRYVRECKEPLTFGQWVMKTFYPELQADPTRELEFRDFQGAQRTTDARYYLIGMFTTGHLDVTPFLPKH